MKLRSLLLCSDEKIVRIVRRTLGDLDIVVEHCDSAESAVRQLTRERFEAIIVDSGAQGSADVLRSAHNAPCNKRAVVVAILDPETGVRSAFDLGAHFVLYKPVSSERAKSSFRVARALMKIERRRNSRIAVSFPVELASAESGARLKANTTDVGEGGMAISLPRRSKPTGRWQLLFTLPGSTNQLKVDAEFAWEGTGTQVGLRFENMSPEVARQMREWVSRSSPDAEKDDPPVRCRLTDLSMGGCYLEIASPFPVSTRVTLSMRVADVDLRAAGVVRVMHPDKGMGVEFARSNAEHRALLEKFLSTLTENRAVLPELMAEPEGLETESSSTSATSGEALAGEVEDPLLVLFRKHAALPADEFLAELVKKRGAVGVAAGVSV
jgi:c-di-GMP-binding flagellar brake protein YcgR